MEITNEIVKKYDLSPDEIQLLVSHSLSDLIDMYDNGNITSEQMEKYKLIKREDFGTTQEEEDDYQNKIDSLDAMVREEEYPDILTPEKIKDMKIKQDSVETLMNKEGVIGDDTEEAFIDYLRGLLDKWEKGLLTEEEKEYLKESMNMDEGGSGTGNSLGQLGVG